MSYSMDFLEMTRHINPLSFVEYLESTGWKVFPRKNPYVKVLQNRTDKELLQVNVPMDKTLSDYQDAMYRTIVTVAKLEKVSLEAVFLRLLSSAHKNFSIPSEV